MLQDKLQAAQTFSVSRYCHPSDCWAFRGLLRRHRIGYPLPVCLSLPLQRTDLPDVPTLAPGCKRAVAGIVARRWGNGEPVGVAVVKAARPPVPPRAKNTLVGTCKNPRTLWRVLAVVPLINGAPSDKARQLPRWA